MNFWDKIAGLYDFAESLNGKVYREMTGMAEKLVPFGAEVLDCAAGTGQLSLAVSDRAEKVVCTDMSIKMLENAQKNAAERGIFNIIYDERNIFELKDEDETYDVVIAGNVLHLLDNPEAAVKELARVTKKGGRILLPTFILGGKMPIMVKLYKLIGFAPAHNYKADEYLRMLEGCGVGKVKYKVIKGKVPCCFALIYKN